MADKEKNADNAKQEESKATKAPAAHAPKDKSSKSKWSLARVQKRAKHYETLEAWEKGNPSSFKAATHWGWIQECSAHMKSTGKVTKLADHKKKKAAPKKKKAAKKSVRKRKSA